MLIHNASIRQKLVKNLTIISTEVFGMLVAIDVDCGTKLKKNEKVNGTGKSIIWTKSKLKCLIFHIGLPDRHLQNIRLYRHVRNAVLHRDDWKRNWAGTCSFSKLIIYFKQYQISKRQRNLISDCREVLTCNKSKSAWGSKAVPK